MPAEYRDEVCGFRYDANRMRDDDGSIVGVEITLARMHENDEEELGEELLAIVFIDADRHADFIFGDESGVHFCDPVELGAFAGACCHVWTVADMTMDLPEKVERTDVN